MVKATSRSKALALDFVVHRRLHPYYFILTNDRQKALFCVEIRKEKRLKIAVCLPVNRIQNSSFVVGVEEGDGDDDKARHFLGGRLRESY